LLAFNFLSDRICPLREVFLENGGNFSFNVTNASRTYRHDFDENGMVMHMNRLNRRFFRLPIPSAFLLLCALGIADVSPAFALSAEAAAFLRSVGMDPNSEAVKIADADGEIHTTFHGDPKVYSLEKLVAEKLKNGVRQFVVMRAFIRRLKADFANTAIPKVDYNGDYLTRDERQLMFKKY